MAPRGGAGRVAQGGGGGGYWRRVVAQGGGAGRHKVYRMRRFGLVYPVRTNVVVYIILYEWYEGSSMLHKESRMNFRTFNLKLTTNDQQSSTPRASTGWRMPSSASS